jgi:hypothetical protein
MSRSNRVRRSTPLLVGAVIVLAVTGLMAPAASAASTPATATITGVSPAAGATSTVTFTLTPSNGQISSFILTVPGGWAITPVPAGGSGLTWTSTTLQGRGLTITAQKPFSATFSVQAPCASTSGLSAVSSAWTVAARTGPNLTGSAFAVNQPSTPVTVACTAAFVSGRGPTDAALNGGATSQAITSVAYTPSADPMQVAVRDGAGNARSGILVTLDANGGGGSEAGGTPSATTDGGGIATFSAAVTLQNIGQGYTFTPTGAFDGTPSGTFGIYQEGHPCNPGCSATGHSSDNKIRSTVTAPNGTNLGVLVSDTVATLDCSAIVQGEAPDYDYMALSGQVTVWKYVGGSTQTLQIFADKTVVKTILNRGSDHIDFCFDSEGKPFVDKFGVTHTDSPSILPDCNNAPALENCIVSETAGGGGGRLITVTINDGRGRI